MRPRTVDAQEGTPTNVPASCDACGATIGEDGHGVHAGECPASDAFGDALAAQTVPAESRS